jgi:hypothetical protein
VEVVGVMIQSGPEMYLDKIFRNLANKMRNSQEIRMKSLIIRLLIWIEEETMKVAQN